MNASADLVVHFAGEPEPVMYQSGLGKADAEAKAKDINHWRRARHPTPRAPTMKGAEWAGVTTVTIVHKGKGAS